MTPALGFDRERIETALDSGPQLAFFASPDNPTGAVLAVDVVRGWCERYPETLFVIDEAYAEYVGASVLPMVADFPNLIVLRSFSKAWGLAGLRLGVLLASPRLIDFMRRVRSPYSVNTVAVTAALQLLDRADDVLVAARDTMSRKRVLVEQVRRRGYRVHDGAANFFLIHVGCDVRGWCRFFRERGVLVRDRSAISGLAGMVRVSAGTDPENRVFLDALDAYRDAHALIFDLDDTLVDTSRSYGRTVAELVSRFAGQSLDQGELGALRLEGGYNDDWDAAAELLRRRGVVVGRAELARAGQGVYLETAVQNEEWMMPDDLLDRLRARYRLLILTGRPRAEYTPVWGKHADARFERVYCRDDFGDLRPKPAPDTLLATLRELALMGGIYVGNSVDDMRAAREAGLRRIGVANGTTAAALTRAGAEHIIPSVSDLGKVL